MQPQRSLDNVSELVVAMNNRETQDKIPPFDVLLCYVKWASFNIDPTTLFG